MGVAESATDAEVRSAYLKLARRHHPDRLVGAPVEQVERSERRMRNVNVSWSVLGDPNRRRRYDSELRAARSGSGGGPRSRAQSQQSGAGSSGSAPRPVYRNVRSDERQGDERQGGARQGGGRPGRGPGGRAADDRDLDDGVDLSPAQFHLLRSGPAVFALVIAVLIFFVTAYARRPAEEPTGPAATPVTADVCAVRGDGRSADLVPCEVPNDGRVVAEADAALDCPARTVALVVGVSFVCVRGPAETAGSDAPGADPTDASDPGGG